MAPKISKQENNVSKQENKTLRQMFDEINQKISETEEKRKAFESAADLIKTETFFLNFCEKILRTFKKINYYSSSDEFYFSHDFSIFVPEDVIGEMNEEMCKVYFVQEIQKYLDKYSPEKLKVEHIIYYSSYHELKIRVYLV